MIIQHLIAPALTLALALGAASSIQAQDANAGAGAPPPWAIEPAKADHTKDIPTDEALLRQHLAGGDAAPSGTVNPAQKMRPPSAAASGPGASQGARDESGNNVAAAVKDFVKPLHQEISNSGVVQVVREIDATVSGRGQADGAEGRPSYSQAGSEASGNNSGSNRGNRKSDPNAAALMWQQFIDEVVPWAIGAAALAGVGYGIYFWLKMIKLKRLKQGDKRRAARRDRHGTTGTPGRATLVDAAPHEAAVPDFRLDARAAPSGSRRSSGSSSRRSSSRSSAGSSGRSSSRSSSRSSGRASGEPTP